MTLNRGPGCRVVPAASRRCQPGGQVRRVGKVAAGLTQGCPVGAEQGVALFVGLQRRAGEMPAGKPLRQANGDAD